MQSAIIVDSRSQSNQSFQNDELNQVGKSPKSGLAIASLILGSVSFIPLLGVLIGLIAIILGAVGLSKIRKGVVSGKKFAIAGIVLGIFGILFSIVLYSSLFYFGFVVKDGPFSEPKKQLSQQVPECWVFRAI